MRSNDQPAKTPAGRGRLRRSDCSGPGLRRRGRGRGFEYFDEGGDRITGEDALERIRDLAIPPAWREVWICPDPLGHLQATGIDDAGRKQYLYHER
ncbi:MAG: DNA topoisomerase IB, partial [Solirubrobacteraceae bacterium]